MFDVTSTGPGSIGSLGSKQHSTNQTRDGFHLRSKLKAACAHLIKSTNLIRLSLALAVGIALILATLWLLNKITIYYLAGSYVDEIAKVFDINKYLANAFVWVTFAALLVFVRYALSFSSRKRMVGFLGLLFLVVGHSVILWYGTSKQFFEQSGKASKCYVVTREALVYRDHPGIDPSTGRECHPVTAEIVERLRAYETGARPERITEAEPTYFDPRTGAPIVWYYKNNNNDIEIFNLMGFHPDTGEELVPVSKDIVDLRKQQIARRAPQPIDPEKYGFFDPITGKPRIWYQHTNSGNYEFYDSPGFDPRTGQPFSLATRKAIDEWREYVRKSQPKKCYVITSDAHAPVRYGDQPGIDPVTGRQCRELTPQVFERLHEYEKGNRPKRIMAADPTFFDPRTGDAIIWYYKNKNGDIELFDLMGFHPETGEELLPISKNIVDLWKTKQQISHKPPQQVDPEKYPFFDPVTGEPRVWFWRESGDYEFYDNRGFHPRTGEQLKVITREDVAKWKQEREAVERTKADEQLRNEHARRERTEQEEQRRQKAPEDQEKFTEGRGQSSPPFDTDNPGQRPAPQPQQILFDHNGSLMSWQRDGPNVRVVYLKPRPGVGAVGIRPGTVLFAGQWSDQRLVGNAHVFATGCPPFPYRVSGGYVSNDVIVMDGAAPVVDPSTCTVLGYTLKSANAHPSYSLIRVGD